jgi:methanogenic corrinoid protein MtbC1
MRSAHIRPLCWREQNAGSPEPQAKETAMQFQSVAADLIASRASLLAAHAVDLNTGGGSLWLAPGSRREAWQEQVATTTLHLRSLSDAMLGASEQLFVDYVDWARTSQAARAQPAHSLSEQLTSLQTVLNDELPDAAPYTQTFLSAAFARLAQPCCETASEIGQFTLAARYLERLLAYDRNGAIQLVSSAVNQGTSVREVYLEVIQTAQHEIGRLWQLNRLSVAQEHYCTAVSQLVLAQLYPLLMHSSGGEPMVATCVAEELHELGARMVADFFEMDGWDTTYVGANAPANDVLQLLRKRRARLLAISATMGFHLHEVMALIDRVRSAPDLIHVKILVGGRPFSVAGTLWKNVGADACANDAQEAVRVGRKLLDLRAAD